MSTTRECLNSRSISSKNNEGIFISSTFKLVYFVHFKVGSNPSSSSLKSSRSSCPGERVPPKRLILSENTSSSISTSTSSVAISPVSNVRSIIIFSFPDLAFFL